MISSHTPSTKASPNQPIAIVGSACRFPGGANTPSKLWDLLREPRDVQTEIPTTRFNPHGFYHPDGNHHGTSNVRHSYLLEEDCRHFDAQFFGTKPIEASTIDPQQRLLLETTYESIEAAGLRIENLRGSQTAVYIGLMCGDYADLQLRDPEAFPTYLATGTARSIMSNRISYFFDWHGPSMTIDTACSSSLVAIHHAVQTLRLGESRVVIAGGSNLCLGPEPYIGESKLAMLSPTGRSRMWDAAADGYARGDGVAAVVLKTLSSALADGDHIECIIRETGVNQDGRTKGITMPSATAQRTLIRNTYARAGLDIRRREDRCQYFEAHGTGTPTGDPIEAEAISSAFFPSGERQWSSRDTLYVGSVKTVIGHTEGTAGLAGLLKASLALQAGFIPPNMFFDNLNPKVRPFYRNLEIVKTATPWPKIPEGAPRRASVNSFGFGGTNAHAILESYEPAIVNDVSKLVLPNVLPFPFAATSERALANTLASYSTYLRAHPGADIRRLAWTLNYRRPQFPVRTMISAANIEALRSKIDQKLHDIKSLKPDSFIIKSAQAKNAGGPILGVFTGQGAQWPSMMKELIKSSDFVVRRLRELEIRLAKLPKKDRPTWSLFHELTTSSSRLKEAELAQPLCTAVQIVLVDLLCAANVRLDAVVGHSSGEIGAAYAAGLLSAEDAICIAYYRGRCTRLACGENGAAGGMIAVGLSHQDAVELCAIPELEGRLSVAACNSSSSFTLSGDREAVELAKDILADEGKFARVLQVDKAYHSYHMKKCSDEYITALKSFGIQTRSPETSKLGESKRPVWYSSVADAVMTADRQELTGTYWNDNMVNPVLFSQAVECAAAGSGPFAMAIEIGPHAALKGPATQVVSELIESAMPYTGVLERNKNDLEALAACMGSIINHLGSGAADLQKLDQLMTEAPKPALLKDLPPYGWNHDRVFWQESRVSRSFRTRDPVNPLLGSRVTDGAEQEFRWRNFLSPKELPWLTGHMIQGQMVFPAAGYMSTCVEAAKAMSRGNQIQLVELTDIIMGQALVFGEENSKVETLFSVTDVDHSNRDTIVANFTFYSAVGEESNTLSANASGKLRIVFGEATPDVLPRQGLPPLEMMDVLEGRFYDVLQDLGYGYTGPFRALTNLKRKLGKATGVAQFLPPIDHTPLTVNPAMLDATIQSIMLAKSWPGDGTLRSLHVPKHIDRVAVNLSLCDPPQGDLLFETSVYDKELSGIEGNINIFASGSSSTIIQMEGVLAVPLDAATPENDRVFFSQMVWDFAAPNGNAVAWDGQASKTDYELAYVLERVAHFYLRQFDEAFEDNHIARRQGPYVGLLRYAAHVAHTVENGKNAYGAREWANDTMALIRAESMRFPDNIDLKVMHVIGTHMPAVIRGEANILEYLKEDKMLDRYYEQAMGITYYTQYLARLVNQVVHRFPHMKILELGAGTGGATKHITKAIQRTFKSYTFTDISSGFFENAQDLFKDYEGKMAFKVLDLEKEISSQGFAEHSYDLVIASFVLHATSKLKKTMDNVRRLLKPGGYLLMLEVTNLEQSRLGFIFGSLPGWWLGAEDKRVLSPCLTKDQWHRLLQDTGFSGIDTATPDLDALPFPASAIVAQAVDPSIEFLREPLTNSYNAIRASPAIDDLVLVGGQTPLIAGLIKDIRDKLSRHVKTISEYTTLEHLDSRTVPGGALALVLGDLDEPIFKAMTQKGLDGLKSLYERSKGILWVTQGSRADKPHHNQSLGFGRSMLVEMAHVRSQFLDLGDPLTASTSRYIAECLLRFAVLDPSEVSELEDLIVWSTEPEMAIDDGLLRVPRIKASTAQNTRYNARNRVVTEQVDVKSTTVEIITGPAGYALHRAVSPDITWGDYVTIEVKSSMVRPVSVGESSALYLVSGIVANTSTTAIALSEKNASVVNVPKNWVTLCPAHVSATILKRVYNYMASFEIVRSLQAGELLAVLDVKENMLRLLEAQAAARNVTLAILSSENNPPGSFPGRILLHKYTTKKELETRLPPNISCFFNASSDNSLGTRIAECLPSTSIVRQIGSVTDNRAHANASLRKVSLSGRLRDGFVAAKSTHSFSSVEQTSSIQLTAISSLAAIEGAHTIIDWTSKTMYDVKIQTIDELTKFSMDKTYWLVGLTGSLGISLCRWMVAHGAGTIVFTSRNPKIDAEILSELRAGSATIKVLAADVTSKESLTNTYNHIMETLPPIAGVVQGAMVLHDTMLTDMTIDQFNNVLRPKVEGSKNLDEIFSENTLDFFIFFSSATCVTGNIGQSNYSVANMFMTGLAAQRRKRGLAGSVINIGAILGVGYVTRETSQALQNNLLKSGHVWMSEQDFHTLFAEGILAGSPSLGFNPEIISGLRIINSSDEQRPLWSLSPKFQHLVIEEDTVVEGEGRVGAGVPIRVRLALVDSPDQAMKMLRETFVLKLHIMLQLEPSTRQGTVTDMRAEDLGIDSLNAVEIRSWLLRELKVDVPVLRILGGSTIGDLLIYIFDNLPAELVPLLGADRRVTGAMIPSVEAPANVTARVSTLEVGAAPLDEDFEEIDVMDDVEDAFKSDFPSMLEPADIVTSTDSIPGWASATLSTDDEDILQTSSGTESFSIIKTSEHSDYELEPKTKTKTKTKPNEKEVGKNVEHTAWQKELPMSYGQSRFWFLKHYLEDQTTFNITASLEVSGKLHVGDLERAVSIVGQRHEALRTCFLLDKQQQPIQRILEKTPLHLEKRDYSNDAEQKLEVQMVKDHAYDLQHGETMRIVLLSPSSIDLNLPQYLIIGYHHINMDGISFQLLLNDLEKTYSHRSLAASVLQYPDYSSRQRQEYEDGKWRDDIEYWRGEFKKLPAILPLLPMASVRQRNTLMRYDHHKTEFRVSPDLAATIRGICKQAKISPYHFYLTAFRALLTRLSGETELCIGVADGGRVEADTLPSIGLFLNLLPLRLQYKSNQSFLEAAKETRSRSYAAMAHSRLPFDVLLTELNVPRSASHSPLFQAFVDYRQSVEERQKFGDCVLEGRDYEVGHTAYDIALDVVDNARGEALLMLAVQAELYSPEAAQTLMRSFTKLIHQFCENPTGQVGAAELYWKEDINQAIIAGRGETKLSKWEKTLPHQVDKMAALYPNNLALKDGSGFMLTFKQMLGRIGQIASALLKVGASSNSSIGVFQDATADWVCSMLAVMRVGAVYVPLDLKVGVERLSIAVKDCKASIIILDNTTRTHLPGLEAPDVLTINVNDLSPSSTFKIANEADPNAPAVILYTSGSTGVPKGAVLRHSGIRNNIEGCSEAFEIGSTDYGLQQISLSFDFSVWQIFMCLANGAGLFIVPRAIRGDPKAITALMESEGITFTGATPSEYISWLRYGRTENLRDSAWTCAVSSGEQLTDTMKKQFQALDKPDLKLFNGYGPTEGSISAANMPVNYFDDQEAARNFTPGGYTQPNYSIYILDDSDQPVPVGMEGQIAISGAGVGLGYLHNPELTAQKFVNDPFASAQYRAVGWTTMHLTGDRGVLRADGALDIQGRISGDTQVKLRGLRMDLRDIEMVIVQASDGALHDAVVSMRRTAEDNPDFLVAHVVFAPEYPRERQAPFLKAIPHSLPLPQYMVPSVFVPLARLSLNAHMKLDRRAVAALALPEASKKHIRFLDTELSAVEEELISIWHQVISTKVEGAAEITKTSDFFHVGGNSLLMVQLRDEIYQHFSIDLPLILLFEASSLGSMAARIQTAVRSGSGSSSAAVESDAHHADIAENPSLELQQELSLRGAAASTQGTTKVGVDIGWDAETLFATNDGALPAIFKGPRNNIPHIVVLTGATGFLGGVLLRRLEQDDRVSKIHCIAVRDPQRYQAKLSSGKVILHAGNLILPRLGLSEDTAAIIFAEASIIIHNGADVSFLKPFASLRAANVGSTQELVQLALPRRVPIHYVSTAGVVQFANRRVVGEEPVTTISAPADLDTTVPGAGYAASKWASEALLEKVSRGFGLPITIHRPSNVSGANDAKPATDVVHSLLRYSRAIGAVPVSDVWDAEGVLDFVSVDTVAEGIVTSATREGQEGRPGWRLLDFEHHSGEVQVELRDVKRFLEKESGRRMRAVPLAVWAAEAEMAGLDPLVAEVVLQAEARGVKMAFPRLVKGQVKGDEHRTGNSRGMWPSLSGYASALGSVFARA